MLTNLLAPKTESDKLWIKYQNMPQTLNIKQENGEKLFKNESIMTNPFINNQNIEKYQKENKNEKEILIKFKKKNQTINEQIEEENQSQIENEFYNKKLVYVKDDSQIQEILENQEKLDNYNPKEDLTLIQKQTQISNIKNNCETDMILNCNQLNLRGELIKKKQEKLKIISNINNKYQDLEQQQDIFDKIIQDTDKGFDELLDIQQKKEDQLIKFKFQKYAERIVNKDTEQFQKYELKQKQVEKKQEEDLDQVINEIFVDNEKLLKEVNDILEEKEKQEKNTFEYKYQQMKQQQKKQEEKKEKTQFNNLKISNQLSQKVNVKFRPIYDDLKHLQI